MNQVERSDNFAGTPATPCPPQRSPDVFYRAVAILRARHHVSESLAYAMLVQDAAHAATTVRQSALELIAESLKTP